MQNDCKYDEQHDRDGHCTLFGKCGGRMIDDISRIILIFFMLRSA